MTSIWELPNVYFQNSTPHQQYPRQQPSTSKAYLSTPMHTLWAKIGWVSIFLKNGFQIDANYLNLRVAKCIFSKSTPHQQYTKQQPSISNSSSTIPQTATFNLKGIFVHSHAHPLSKNWLSQHIFKKRFPNWRKLPQFESCQMYIFKIYSSSTIHQATAFNLKCIFVHSHVHPLSKNWLSLHIFKKQIPNWRKLPQFESCQMYIFKIYSSSTIHHATAFNLKCIFLHSHAPPLGRNWLSQHIFKKQIPNWRKWPLFESWQMYMFKTSSPSTIHQTTTFNLKSIFVHSHVHPLSKNWLSLHIFKKQIPNWRKLPQFESCQMYIFKIYSSSTIHHATAFNLKCIFLHTHAPPLGRNWLSQHIFKKQIPNWRKWPLFESWQMYMFKTYSSSTIHQTTTFNLKSIFVHSHVHPLSKNWLSQHIFNRQFPNWRKLPQFESFQMYIFKIYSSSTIHQTTTFNLKSIFVHSHVHPLSRNWLSQHIFKKQIPNWRKWPLFESWQMYMFKTYSSSTVHQTTTFNLKSIFVHSHVHPLSKNWLSQHIFKRQFPNWRNYLNLRVSKCIFSKSTPHQQYTKQQPSTSNPYLSTPMYTLWAKIGRVSIFLKNGFQIDANYLNLRVAKCLFSKSTPHQQYTKQQPSTSNPYLSTPMYTLWAKIGWVCIFLKNRFQIDVNYLNLRVAKCIFSKSTPHQQYTMQQPSTSNTYFSTPMHPLWAEIGWVSIFLKNRFQIDANDLYLRVGKCICSKPTPRQKYTRQQHSTSNAYLSTPMHTPLSKN